MREIDQDTKSLNRETEDAQADLDQEQNKIMQELGQRMMAVIDKYAKDNGYTRDPGREFAADARACSPPPASISRRTSSPYTTRTRPPRLHLPNLVRRRRPPPCGPAGPHPNLKKL